MRLTTILILFYTLAFAQEQYTLKGLITDENDAPLPQAVIRLAPGNASTVSDDDGVYFLSQITAGQYEITAEYTGFKDFSDNIKIDSDRVFNIQLTDAPIEITGITTTAMRADRESSPVTFSEIKKEALTTTYNVQDVPMLLQYSPGAYAYSETGTGIGYTHFNIRGFSQQRMNVMVNGIPYNDPESHGVFWVDLPDLLNNAKDVQIQRGVGFSTDGAAAFGGSIDLRTWPISIRQKADFEFGYGSYNTRKYSASFSTGMIDKFSFYGRFSNISSDGYRDRTAADLWSWFISGVYVGKKTKWQINTFGGKEITQLAWNGANPAMIAANRKANDTQFDKEIDDYFQPHFQLLVDHQISKQAQLSASLFYVFGEGYYQQFKEAGSYRMAEILLPDSIMTDKFIQKWLRNHHYGIQTRLKVKSDLGNSTFGLTLRRYDGDHFGDLVQAKEVAFEVLNEPLRFYNNYSTKNYASLFLNHNWPVNSKLNLMADIQLRYINYERQQEKMTVYQGYSLALDYFFVNPKIGIMYKINTDLNLFASASISNREPTGNDYFDPKDPSSVPNLDIKNETVLDFETGLRYELRPYFTLDANLYYMQFNNEILANGQVDDEGNPIHINADNSFRSGIELKLDGSYRNFTYGINGSVSYNRISSYTEYIDRFDADWNWLGQAEINYSDVKTAYSPDFILNSYLGYIAKYYDIILQQNYVGNQYVENNEHPSALVEAYQVYNLLVNLKLPGIFGGSPVITFKVNNLLDADYWQPAYVWWKWIQGGTLNYDTRYYVGAPRNYYVSLKLYF